MSPPLPIQSRSQDGAVGIATGYVPDGQRVGVAVLVGARLLSVSRPALGTGGFFLGIRWPGREGENSPPTHVKVKHMWVYASTPPYASMEQCRDAPTAGSGS
jgi:hypothetical protein